MIKKLFNFDNFDNIGITGLTNELTSFCCENIYETSKRNIIIVTNSLYEANTTNNLKKETERRAANVLYRMLIRDNEN